MRINFVMSNTVNSAIFNAIINYFKTYLDKEHELFVSQYPIDNCDIYHYHRPNLEDELLANSIVTVHHDLEDTDPWFDASIFIERYHQANHIICLNSMQKEFLYTNEDLSNTTIIPHAVNDKIFTRKIKQSNNGKFTIGIVSKYYGRRVKGEALLYELYKRLDNTRIKFIFVGEGRSIHKTELKALGFECDTYEALPYAMFNQLYHEIDILLISSLFEGGPANVPEALYTNTPIVGRKIAMISDMVFSGKNGYFLSGNPDRDAELLNDLALNTNNLFSNLQTQTIENNFNILTWKDVVEQHIAVYSKVIKERNNED